MSWIKRFFWFFGISWGLAPGERYACFDVPDLKKASDLTLEWLDDGGAQKDLDGRAIVGYFDNVKNGEVCFTITDSTLETEEIIKVLATRGFMQL